MRKLICCILIIFCLITIFPVENVFGEESYSYKRILCDDAEFFSDEDCQNFLFYLPYSYYVKTISYAYPTSHVELYTSYDTTLKIDGYVKTEFLEDALTFPTTPYLNLQLTVSTQTVLYANADKTQIIRTVFANRQVNYYGYLFNSNQEMLLYVNYGEDLGYISYDMVQSFYVPLNTDPILTSDVFEEESIEEEIITQSTSPTVKYVIFALLIIIVALIIFSMFIKKPQQLTEEDDSY